jgi:predicted XRE-type DNA-binding protein
MVARKPVEFRGSSLDDLRAFPGSARHEAEHQIDRVQQGYQADDWKPMPTVGAGVQEIKIRDAQGRFVSITSRCLLTRFMSCTASGRPPRKPTRRILIWPPNIIVNCKGARQVNKKRFASVWDAIEDTPEKAENMKLRSSLMIALKGHLAGTGLSQGQIAKLFGVTQPRVSDLMRGKIDVFGLDALVNMAAAAGLRVKLSVRKAA